MEGCFCYASRPPPRGEGTARIIPAKYNRASGEDCLAVGQDLVQGVGEMGGRLGQLRAHLLAVFLPAFPDLILEQARTLYRYWPDTFNTELPL